jgi:hypothetical protein
MAENKEIFAADERRFSQIRKRKENPCRSAFIRVNPRLAFLCQLPFAIFVSSGAAARKRLAAWPKKLLAATSRVLFFLFASHDN